MSLRAKLLALFAVFGVLPVESTEAGTDAVGRLTRADLRTSHERPSRRMTEHVRYPDPGHAVSIRDTPGHDPAVRAHSPEGGWTP